MLQLSYPFILSFLLAFCSFLFWVYLVKVLLSKKLKEHEFSSNSEGKNSNNFLILFILSNLKFFLIYKSYLLLISENTAEIDIVYFALSFASVYFLFLIFFALKKKI